MLGYDALAAAALLVVPVTVLPQVGRATLPAAATAPDIVVTGPSLAKAKAVLAACLQEHCPPDKDIDATLAVAETQFVAGDYAAARTTLLKSIGRKHRYAKTYPVLVSDLPRSNSRVAAHLG